MFYNHIKPYSNWFNPHHNPIRYYYPYFTNEKNPESQRHKVTCQGVRETGAGAQTPPGSRALPSLSARDGRGAAPSYLPAGRAPAAAARRWPSASHRG